MYAELDGSSIQNTTPDLNMDIVRSATAIVVFLSIYRVCSTLSRIERNVVCTELPSEVLKNILGGAFNSRYMSITPPMENGNSNDKLKRESAVVPPFYVDQDFAQELGSNEPAWTVHHSDLRNNDNTRSKRRTTISRQWDCEAKIAWSDLGLDYYPRYLRSVECLSKSCWYGHYACKPRSFTVKVLKRRRGQCVFSDGKSKVGIDGLPRDLKELWVWEERAVNFCCDCSL